MQRHMIDRTKPRSDAARLREFLRIERAAGPVRAVLAAQRRQMTRDGLRMTAFLRVARGQTA